MIQVLLVAISFSIGGYLIYRFSRRGISKRYERKPQTPWNALSEGIDPTL
jgi:hypothetical protein